MSSSKDLTCKGTLRQVFISVSSIVADPGLNPDPLDPYVFGPPRSFYHQAKILVRKTLIPTAFFVTSF